MIIFNFEILEISEMLKPSLMSVESSNLNKESTLVSLLNMVLEECLLLILSIHFLDLFTSVFSRVVWSLLFSTIITFNNYIFFLSFMFIWSFICMIKDILEMVVLLVIDFILGWMFLKVMNLLNISSLVEVT